MKPYKVNDLKKVDPTRYVEGDVFTTDKQLAVLHQGQLEPLVMVKDLKGYVKKTEIKKMITDELKKGEDK